MSTCKDCVHSSLGHEMIADKKRTKLRYCRRQKHLVHLLSQICEGFELNKDCEQIGFLDGK